MDAKEGMAGRGEHRISVVENAGGSGERVGTGIHEEEVTSPAIEPSVDERWVGGVQEKIARALTGPQQPSWLPDAKRERKICKFPLGQEFCQPRVVTIGPYHRDKRTSIGDEEKWQTVNLMNHFYGLDLARCLTKMKILAADARACYADTFESSGFEHDEAFAELLLLDSYFILFMLTCGEIGPKLMNIEPDFRAAMEKILFPLMPSFGMVLLQRDNIMLDLLILDNQIPFFVIEELLKELNLEKQPLHIYAYDFFDSIHPRPNPRRKGRIIQHKFLHLFELFHLSRLPHKMKDVVMWPFQLQDGVYRTRGIPTATELRESATIFEKKTSGSSQLSVRFRRGWLISIIGVLVIPKLHIHDYSSFIFHNLIAFEMQCPSHRRHAMAFSAFMRNLLQREEDVKLLRRRGVLANKSMTDKDLVDFFRGLSRLTENYEMPRRLYDIYGEVLSHHSRRISQFCGSVVLQYFPNPLVTLSVFAAAMLFVLTLLQTIYSMFSYYNS